ncbi:MAG: adaptor protein MecA [Defluviitaleaceae bacterium]|nr:adaptor protein MecA [Defluviitaleaceae bacterium]
MRIEKVNDKQIKFILGKEELESRGLKITELDKSQSKLELLVQEIKHEAMVKLGFFLNDTHHMVEVVPTHFEELTIIVTKISNPSISDNRNINNINNINQTAGGIGHKSITAPNFKHIQSSNYNQPSHSYSKENRRIKNVYIYGFKTLEQVIEVSKLINGYFLGYSKVYKFENEYYIVLEGRLGEEGTSFLIEHGEEVKNLKLESKFKEYGEVILNKDAISKLANL